MKFKTLFGFALLLCFITFSQRRNNPHYQANQPFIYTDQSEPCWVSFENPKGKKGAGGTENNGAKGHPSERLEADKTKTILDLEGPGIINRMWFTLRPRSKQALRGLVLNMYWDHEEKPAVSVPFGDFFSIGLGQTTTFETALFANPEGRSFVSYVQMPFHKAARIEIVNELDFPISLLFYDIDLQRLNKWDSNFLYFHAYWHRDMVTTLAEDFEILPKVEGRGRFLGANISIQANPVYKDSWWGEGEVKMYLDGDTEFPSLVGTGTEDYIGTGWGQGPYFNRYQGCAIAEPEKLQWSFYRYHLPDPIYFKTDCKVTIQQMGGSQKKNVIELLKNNVPLIPVTINGDNSTLIHLYEKGKINDLSDPNLPNGEAWTNFYRSDDMAAVAYFYLDGPTNNLPRIQSLETRVGQLR